MLLKSAMYGINAANYVKTYRLVYNESADIYVLIH